MRRSWRCSPTPRAPRQAAAKALGSYGPRAKAAVPVMIDFLKTREKDDYPYPAYDAVALALNGGGKDAYEGCCQSNGSENRGNARRIHAGLHSPPRRSLISQFLLTRDLTASSALS